MINNKVQCQGCNKELAFDSNEDILCLYDNRRCAFSGCDDCMAKHIPNCPQKDKTDQEVFPEMFNIEQQTCNQCDGGNFYQKKVLTDSTLIRSVYLVEIPDATKYVCPDCGDTREELGFNVWVQKKRAEKIKSDLQQGLIIPTEAVNWLKWAEKYYGNK